MMKRHIIGFISIVLINLLFLLYLGKYGLSWSSKLRHPAIQVNKFATNDVRRNSTKRILVYTSFFGDKPWSMARPLMNYTKTCGCNFEFCEITYDQSKLNTSDIVLFHGRNMADLNQVSKQRPLNQLWLYFIMENPYHASSVEGIDRYFNLTSSYRLSSNIHYPYRFHHPIPPSEVKEIQPSINYASGKTKQIAWAVSNCGHQRDQLAKKFNEFGLHIDNFGNCRFPFAKSRYFSRSVKSPYHEYKFVFAAENRLCEDYVTEKYWSHAFDNNVNAIPIVLGGSNYSNPAIAIPGSFIDALKFTSPKTLAEYLLIVDKNDTLFNEYFKWRQYWTFYDKRHPSGCNPFICNMCDKLHENSWNLRNKPLLSTINSDKECKPTEDYFNRWIKMV